jgi:hypothetical protein
VRLEIITLLNILFLMVQMLIQLIFLKYYPTKWIIAGRQMNIFEK